MVTSPTDPCYIPEKDKKRHYLQVTLLILLISGISGGLGYAIGLFTHVTPNATPDSVGMVLTFPDVDVAIYDSFTARTLVSPANTAFWITNLSLTLTLYDMSVIRALRAYNFASEAELRDYCNATGYDLALVGATTTCTIASWVMHDATLPTNTSLPLDGHTYPFGWDHAAIVVNTMRFDCYYANGTLLGHIAVTLYPTPTLLQLITPSATIWESPSNHTLQPYRCEYFLDSMSIRTVKARIDGNETLFTV